MILPIKHKVYWELLRQRNQAQTSKKNIRKNIKRDEHDYKVGDKVMLNNSNEYKQETPYTAPFVITQC